VRIVDEQFGKNYAHFWVIFSPYGAKQHQTQKKMLENPGDIQKGLSDAVKTENAAKYHSFNQENCFCAGTNGLLNVPQIC